MCTYDIHTLSVVLLLFNMLHNELSHVDIVYFVNHFNYILLYTVVLNTLDFCDRRNFLGI